MAEMRNPKVIWRCPCGAVLTSSKALRRHVEGKTMCQRRGNGVESYRRTEALLVHEREDWR